jgi:hypothetical protein
LALQSLVDQFGVVAHVDLTVFDAREGDLVPKRENLATYGWVLCRNFSLCDFSKRGICHSSSRNIKITFQFTIFLARRKEPRRRFPAKCERTWNGDASTIISRALFPSAVGLVYCPCRG